MIEVIKQTALKAIKAEKPMEVVFGTVKSLQPLKIELTNSFTLSEKQVVVDSLLEEGESVVLLKQQGGQKYLVLSTIAKEIINSEYINIGGNSSGWITVMASAYDDVGQLTANGERLTWNSKTVAVPMGEVYRKNKNKRIQIKYNNKIVTARVTDCGNFGAGNKYPNRELDLAPGIWKGEFGVATTNKWGLREVQYRYID